MAKEGPAQEEAKGGQTHSGNNGPQEFSVPVRIIEDPVQADYAKEREQKSDEHDAKDLQAQDRAANAAVESAASAQRQEYLARWQLALSVAGIIALFYTLLLSRRANKAAWAAVAATKITGEAQTRAYILVTEPKLSFEMMEDDPVLPAALIPYFHCYFRNSGNTPARHTRLKMNIAYAYRNDSGQIEGTEVRENVDMPPKNLGTFVPVMHDGGHKYGTYEGRLTDRDIKGFESGEFYAYVTIDTAFTDVFKEEITDQYRFVAKFVAPHRNLQVEMFESGIDAGELRWAIANGGHVFDSDRNKHRQSNQEGGRDSARPS